MEVTADVPTIQQMVHSSLKKNHYSRDASSTDNIFRYYHGNLVTEMVSNATGWDLIKMMAGRPTGFGQIVAWVEATADGHRLSLSLTTGVAQAKFISIIFDELVAQFSGTGQLLRVSEPYSGMDLPLESPGRPLMHGGRKT